MQALAIVATAGLGHFRRTVRILGALLTKAPDLSLTLVCENWQLERLRTWPALQMLLDHGARVVSGVTYPGIEWSSDPAIYTDGRLLAWEERLRNVPGLGTADLVVSDNLVGVLDYRADAVLLGSFLWSDVLERAHGEVREVARFVERDRGRLAHFRPPMLCVADVAMPAVVEQTQAVPLPWMCEWTSDLRRPSSFEPKTIAILGGATGAANSTLVEAATSLAISGRWRLVADNPVRAALRRSLGIEIAAFGHADTDYAQCALVVCRPGVGSVTDCVASAVPILLAYEPNNPELSHNAARLEELGYGRNLGAHPPSEVWQNAVEMALEPQTHQRQRELMAGARRDGLERAAAWLYERLHGTLQRSQASQGELS
jgi:hypothetical protein